MRLTWRRLGKLTTWEGWRWGLAHAEDEAWERFFGVDTRRTRVAGHAAVPEGSIRYEPLPWFLVRRGVEAMRLTRDDVFVDYGAGLGRVLLMAARRELKRVVGVELLPPLARSALENLDAARNRLRTPVDVVVSDASTWEVPDDLTAAYLFNPFVGGVMTAVQAKLRASLMRRPRKLRVLYAHADDQRDLFADAGFVSLQRSMSGGVFRNLSLKLYESSGPVPPLKSSSAASPVLCETPA